MTGKTIRRIGCGAVLAAAAAMSSCSGGNWRWDWWNKDTEQKPVTKAQPRTAEQPRTAKAGPAERPAPAPAAAKAGHQQEDARSKEVEAQVQQYVQSMNAAGDQEPADAYNDFNSKIERQNDPNRRGRIQRTADMGRQEPEASGTETPRKSEASVSGEARPKEPAVQAADVERKEAEPAVKPAAARKEPAERAATPTELSSNQPQPRETVASKIATGEKKTADEQPEPAEVVLTPSESEQTQPQPKSETLNADEPSKAKDEKPPVLSKITVSPAAEPKTDVQSAAKQSDAGATPNARPATTEGADSFRNRLKEQEALVAKDPANLAEQYRLRMMYLIDSQDDKAQAPADGMDAETNQLLLAQVRALIAARTSAGRDPAVWATKLTEPVEELRDLLRSRADLMIPKVVLCKSIEGFGVYEPIDPRQFAAGRKGDVLIYVEVENFSSEKTASGFYRTLLALRPSLYNKAGEELWSTSYNNIEDLSRARRQDFFLTVNQTIPATLSPGEYVLKIEVEDMLAGKINSNQAKFKVVTP